MAHVGENLLTRLRDGQLILNPEITTGLLSMVDAVRQMLKEIESTGQDGDDGHRELLRTLARLQGPAANPATPVSLKEEPDQPVAKNSPPQKSYFAHRSLLMTPELFDLLEGAAFRLWHEAIGKDPSADCAEAVEPKSFRSADSLQKRKKRKAH